MYAKLVTNAVTWNATNIAGYFNGLIGVITGSITATSGLDATAFNQGSSQIISTVAPGWSVHDSNAGTAISAGSTPVVIRAPWSDDGTKHKYLWVAPVTSNASGYVHVKWIPAEGWDSATNTGTNILQTPPSGSLGYTSDWNECPAYGNIQNGSAFTTVISASANHLFIWVSYNTSGLGMDSHFYLSEYTRDDAWNTVANGYPAWLCSGAKGGGYEQYSASNTENGTLIRYLNPGSGTDSNQLAMYYSNPNTPSYMYWGLTSRYRRYRVYPGNSNAYFPVSLATAAASSKYFGNDTNARDASKTASLLLSDIRWEPLYNVFLAGGSLTAKAPYIYLFRSQWQSLDEVDIAGQRYTNLICNHYTPGSGSSTLLIKQV